MNHHIAIEVNHLGRLVERAQAYQRIGRQSGNVARLNRAARLEIAAEAKLTGIVMSEVSAYISQRHESRGYTPLLFFLRQRRKRPT